MGIFKIADRIKKATLPFVITGVVIALCSCAKKEVPTPEINRADYLMEVRVLVSELTGTQQGVVSLAFTERYKISNGLVFGETISGGVKPESDFTVGEPYIEFLRVLDATDKDIKVLVEGEETFLNLNEKYSFNSKYATHPDSKVYQYEVIFSEVI